MLCMASVRWLYLFLFEGRHLMTKETATFTVFHMFPLYSLVLESVYSLKSKNRVSHQ